MRKVLTVIGAIAVIALFIGVLSSFANSNDETTPAANEIVTQASQGNDEQVAPEENDDPVAPEENDDPVAPEEADEENDDPVAPEPEFITETYEIESADIEYEIVTSAGADTTQVATIGWNKLSAKAKDDIIRIAGVNKAGNHVNRTSIGHEVISITKVTFIDGIPVSKTGYDKQMLVEYKYKTVALGTETTGDNQVLIKRNTGITNPATIKDMMNMDKGEGCCLCFGGYINECAPKPSGNCVPCGDTPRGQGQYHRDGGNGPDKPTNSKGGTRVTRETSTAGNGSQSPQK